MDEQDVTQATPEAVYAPEPAPPVPEEVLSAKAAIPRRWFAAAVIAVLLVAAGVGFYLGTRGEDGPVVKGKTPMADVEPITVPDLRGMTLERAGQEVLDVGLAAGTISLAVVEESVAPSGTVLSQDPLPGALVSEGAEVHIVLAQAPSATVVADAGASGASASSGSSGTDPVAGTSPAGDASAGGPPAVPPVLPDLPPSGSIDISKLQPRVVDPGLFKLVQPAYRTVVEHEGFSADAWQSPALTFGDKPKRVLIAADGPQYVPIAVWAWGPTDSDWKLKTIWASFPGAVFVDDIDNGGGTLVESFDAGPGTYTVLVRLNPDVTWWKVRIEEQE